MTDEAPCSAACVQHLQHAVAAELVDEIVDQCKLDTGLEPGIDDGCVGVRDRLVEGAGASGQSVVHGTTVTSGADKRLATRLELVRLGRRSHTAGELDAAIAAYNSAVDYNNRVAAAADTSTSAP